MSDRPTVTQQYAFSMDDGEADGIEPSEESVETSLETFGADVDHRERDTRMDQPEATSFGVDDRKTITRNGGGEQHALFADTEDDQRTLGGERAANQCLFESNEQDNPDDEHAEEPDTASDEPTDTTTEASPRTVATDGGRVGDDDSGVQTDENAGVVVAIPRLKLASVADYVEYERNTVERHVGKGPKTAELTQYVEECRSALSVLDDTDDNGHISRVVAAGTADELDQSAERHHGEVEQELRELVGVLRQALDEQPASDDREGDESADTDEQDDDRNDEADASPEENEDTTFDPDAETVTDAWEGAFLSAQWGYEQTNVELVQIVEVSGSGKTVLVRMVVAERVGHGRNSTQLRPTAEQYGDEFRLHVRSSGGNPAFRGSYPLSNDGDMDDGPTRREWFYPFNNDPENSVRRTAINHGH